MMGEVIDWSHPQALGLIGAWLLNEAAGTTAHDLGPYARHGTLASAPTWGVNDIGRPALDTHSAGKVLIPTASATPLIGASGATIISRIKRSGLGNYDMLGMWTLGDTSATSVKVALYFGGSQNKCGIYARSVSTDTAQALSLATGLTDVAGWYTIAGVVDLAKAQLTIYLDGNLSAGPSNKTFGKTTFSAEVGTNHSIAGGAFASGWDKLDGYMDYTMLYNRALTADEVRAAYLQPYAMYAGRRW